MSILEYLEYKMRSYLCIWHSLPHGLGSIGEQQHAQTPYSSVREVFNVAQAWEHLQYSGSRDTKVSGTGMVVEEE